MIVALDQGLQLEPLNALINYLRTPEAIGVIKVMGMQPG